MQIHSTLSDDQEQFRNIVVRFLKEKSGAAEARRLMVTRDGYDQSVWQQMCNELGLAGTHLPEACGGFGFGPAELGIVAEEMGRHLYCGPFFASSVMAAYGLLLCAGEEHRQSLLPGIATGTTLATLVLDDLNRPDRLGRRVLAADGCLSGTAPLVVDAQVAQLLIVVAGGQEGPGLYCLPADRVGVSIQLLETLDQTRKLCSVEFNQAEAEWLGQPTADQLEDIWDHISVALAHELTGAAQHLLESTVEYTCMRYQFGRPIGSFQGLKHRCADLLMEVEFARAATYHAARCLAAGVGEKYAPAMAKALASDTCMKAAKEAIQMRGGIGFTWEEDTHLWYKRAKSSEVFMGTAAMHRERMMRIIDMQQEEA